jgi:hypothetical protein
LKTSLRNINSACRLSSSQRVLTGAEWRVHRSLKADGLLTVLPADNGNAAVVLGTSDYNRKIATFPEDRAYMKLKKDPTHSIEQKTVLLKKSPLAEEVWQQLRPQGSTPPRLCGMPKIHEHYWFPQLPLSPTFGRP